MPPEVDLAEAAALVMNYVTAYQMLHRSVRVQPEQRALIHGAVGGIGTALLELGRLSDLRMYGTGRRADQRAITRTHALDVVNRCETFTSRTRVSHFGLCIGSE